MEDFRFIQFKNLSMQRMGGDAASVEISYQAGSDDYLFAIYNREDECTGKFILPGKILMSSLKWLDKSNINIVER